MDKIPCFKISKVEYQVIEKFNDRIIYTADIELK